MNYHWIIHELSWIIHWKFMNYHPMSHEYLNLPLISHGSPGSSNKPPWDFAWPRWMWAACRKVPEPSYMCHTVSYVIMYKHTNIYAHIYIHICVYVYIYIHIYIYVCIHIYIYTHIHNIYIYIHIHTVYTEHNLSYLIKLYLIRRNWIRYSYVLIIVIHV